MGWACQPHLASYSKNSRDSVEYSIRLIVDYAESMGLSSENDLTQGHINVFLDRLRESGISNNTYNQRVSLIKKALDSKGLKFEYKKKPATAYSTMKMISEEMILNIVIEAKNDYDLAVLTGSSKANRYYRNYTLFHLSYLTGMRCSEILITKHSDYRQNFGKWECRSIGKGDKEFVTPISNDIASYIKVLKGLEDKNDSDYVFTGDDKERHFSRDGYWTLFKTYLNKIGHDSSDATLHDIRNLSGYMVYKKHGILAAKSHLRHSQLETTHRYVSACDKKVDGHYSELEINA